MDRQAGKPERKIKLVETNDQRYAERETMQGAGRDKNQVALQFCKIGNNNKIPTTIASEGRLAKPYTMAKVAKIPESAPAGPIILKLLPAKMEAMSPAQTAVIIPWSGVAPEAIAREIESGMETSATVIPDFQLDFTLSVINASTCIAQHVFNTTSD